MQNCSPEAVFSPEYRLKSQHANIGLVNEFLGYGILIDGGIGRDMGKGVWVRGKLGGGVIENRGNSGKGERLREEKWGREGEWAEGEDK